jgi:hypothetical protein
MLYVVFQTTRERVKRWMGVQPASHGPGQGPSPAPDKPDSARA